MKKALLSCLLIFASLSYGAVLGDFSSSRILPGYIDLNPDSPFYQGIINSFKNSDEIDRRSPSQIMQAYFEGDKFSVEKFKLLESQIDAHEKAFQKYLCIDEFRKEVKSYDECDGRYLKKKKFKKEWAESRYSLVFKLLDRHRSIVKSMGPFITASNINDKVNIDFLESFFTIIELYYSFTESDVQKGGRALWEKALITAQGIFTPNNRLRNHKIHASNLINISNPQKSFYSFEELESLKASGEDLSKLEPYDSGIWRKPKISIKNYVMETYNQEGIPQLKKYFSDDKIQDLIHKDKIIDLHFDGDKLKGGNTPKFDVKYAGTKFKLKFITSRQSGGQSDNVASPALRNLWGSEVNVEPAANHLAAAMGFVVDPTYYKKHARLYIDEEKLGMKSEEAMQDLIERLNEKYLEETNVASAFEDLRVDENGRKYFFLKSITLESKSNEATDMNVGFFRRMGLGKTLKREHRALFLFMSWIADPDIKDDNTKVKIVPVQDSSGNVTHKVVLSNSDMGGAFGIGYPNIFNFDLIKKIKKKKGKLTEIELRYMRLFNYKMKHAINFDDAKWMTRRIAQLSVDQITQAFEYSGFPTVVAKYYALLLAKKRNQLVDIFDMEGETFLDDGGEEFTIKKIAEFEGTVPGYEEFFRNYHLTDPDNKLFDLDKEHFPRFWGVSWRNRDTERPQREVLKEVGGWILKELISLAQNSLSERVHFGKNGIRIASRGLFMEGGLFRQGNKFIEGMDAGVFGIFPVRNIIANPDPDSEMPFLLVDTLRFGVYAAEEQNFLKHLGISIQEISRNLIRGSKLYYLKEVIKTTPVKSMTSFFSKPLNPFKMKENDWRNFLKEDFIKAKAGENYIVSHYVGIDSGFRLRPHFAPISSIRLEAGMSLAKRSMLFGGDKLSLRRTRETEFNFQTSLNLLDFIYQYPLASLKISRKKFIDKVYEFDKETSIDQLLDCVDSKFNSKVCGDDDAQKARRVTKVREKKSFFGLLTLFERHSSRRYIFRDLENYETDTHTGEKLYQYSKQNLDWIKLDWGDESLVSNIYTNKSGDVELLINYLFTDSVLESDTLRRTIERNQSLFPEDIVNAILNDPLKHYMGNSIVSVDITFSKESLDKLFTQDLKSFCEGYSAFVKKEHICTETSAPKYIYKIWKKVQRLVSTYKSVVANKDNDKSFRAMKRLARFFYDNKYKRKIVGYLVSISKKSEFRRDVEIWSHVNPFPNDMQGLKESDLAKGSYKSRVNNETRIPGDDIVDAISVNFFNYK